MLFLRSCSSALLGMLHSFVQLTAEDPSASSGFLPGAAPRSIHNVDLLLSPSTTFMKSDRSSDYVWWSLGFLRQASHFGRLEGQLQLLLRKGWRFCLALPSSKLPIAKHGREQRARISI
jgi:hypothetical protein